MFVLELDQCKELYLKQCFSHFFSNRDVDAAIKLIEAMKSALTIQNEAGAI